MNRIFAYGDKVLLIDSKKRRYLTTLVEKGEFHSHSGFVAHDLVIGQTEGAVIPTTKGALFSVLRPTLEDFVLEMPRGAQVIYPKDLAPICMIADIGPDTHVFESGIGSGALSMTMLRYGATITGYEIREDFANRAKTNVRSFLGEQALNRYAIQIRDAYEGIDGTVDGRSPRVQSAAARRITGCLYAQHYAGGSGTTSNGQRVDRIKDA